MIQVKRFILSIRNRQHRAIREFEPHEILDLTIPFDRTQKNPYIFEVDGYKSKISSLRYDCFRKSKTCVCCGITGTKILLEKDTSRSTTRAHFNLYAEFCGGLILMTKDHIRPRSRGGQNTLDNCQTMCEICNSAKGNQRLSMEELRELQEVNLWMRILDGNFRITPECMEYSLDGLVGL